MTGLEVVGEGVQFGGRTGVAAEVEAVVEAPGAAGPPKAVLEGPYLRVQEAALEDRDAEGALLGGETRGQSREGAAGAAGDRDDVGVAAQLLAEGRAAAYGEGVAAALRDDVRVLGAAAAAADGGEGRRGRPCARYVDRSTKCRRMPSAAQRAREGLRGRSASSSPRTTPTVGTPRRRPAVAVARRWLE